MNYQQEQEHEAPQTNVIYEVTFKLEMENL